MNEDLRRCLESVQGAVEELKVIRNSLTINDVNEAQKAFGLSNEMVRILLIS